MRNPVEKLIFDEYNKHHGQLPLAYKLTPQRERSMRARISEYGVDKVLEVVRQAADIDFLAGDNERGWRADLDFILSPRGFLGIIEGKYKTSKKKKAPRGLDYAQRPYTEEEINRQVAENFAAWMHEDEESPEDRMKNLLRKEAEEAAKKMREEVELTEKDIEAVKKMFRDRDQKNDLNRSLTAIKDL